MGSVYSRVSKIAGFKNMCISVCVGGGEPWRMAGDLCVLMEGKPEKSAGAELGRAVQLWAWLLHKRQSCVQIIAPIRQVFMCLHGRCHVCSLVYMEGIMCPLFSLHRRYNVCTH